jgi:hypothetical protein
MNSLPSFLLRPQICPRVSLSFPQVYLVTPFLSGFELDQNVPCASIASATFSNPAIFAPATRS